jgi:hypothetical protein
LTGSLSVSIELRALMAESSDSRLRCSGGRLRGCVSGSTFFRREEARPASVGCRANGREVRGDCGLDECSRDVGEAGRWDEEEEEAAFLVGDREPEDLVGDLVGEDGCDESWKPACSSSSSSAEFGFLDDILEKNFICKVLRQKRRPLPGSGLL